MEEIKRIPRERKERKATATAFGTREPSRCETCGRIEGRNKAYGMAAGNFCTPTFQECTMIGGVLFLKQRRI